MNEPYPVIAEIVGRDARNAIDALYHYVRPHGDYILVRSQLDDLDKAFAEIESHLASKYNGFSWADRHKKP
jgi:hypothetical protein